MRRLSYLGTMMFCMLVGGSAIAETNHGGRCHRIRAEINLATGTIDGNFGLDGTLVFVQDSTGTAPPTAPPSASVFSGLLTVTTPRGSLVVRETGTFSSRAGNPSGPLLSSFGETLSGTGHYAGVTGDLFFAGRVIDGVFLVELTGELCRP